jgi:acyl-CoA thioester hydrolase
LPSLTQLRVRYAETDQMGIVYHTNYLVWCEIGRTELMRSLGTTYADIERRGILLAISDVSLRLHASARYDDVVRVETRLTEVRSRQVTFDYAVTRESGERLATARTALVSIAPGGRPTALPADLRERLDAAVDR